jgi:molecular chaperone DnaK (HSP70)
MGAALYTAFKSEADIKQIPGMAESRTVPHSLGVKLECGKFDKIIPRHYNIPCKNTEDYKTASDLQTRIRLQVFEGENEIAIKNKKLGEFVLENIPPLPEGEAKVEVTIFVNEDTTVIDVMAKCKQNNEYKRVLVGYEGNRLTEKERQEIIEKNKESYSERKYRMQTQRREEHVAYLKKVQKDLDDPRKKKYFTKSTREALSKIISNQNNKLENKKKLPKNDAKKLRKELFDVWGPIFDNMCEQFNIEKGYKDSIDTTRIDDID